ncbi:MAG: cupin domain-containing protein [Proteobacteria bacterium]|nr:cupin domain-containing protein [Pseudomonadota bacterium]MDA1071520.1 cupin domain-containing protein [Pseudomonadota bacterium]
MADLKPIAFHADGPAGKGLETWEEIPASALVAGTPVQRGHNYFTDETGTLTAGVWDCTPMTTKCEPYSVNEFMYVLEGSVTIVHENGTEWTIRAGESFVIPKGAPVTWKQTEYMRKFYVILDDAELEAGAADTLTVRRPDPAEAIPAVGEQDTSRYIGAVPTQHVKSYYSDPTGQFTVGIWDTTEMHTKPLPFVRNELMFILEGEVTITNADGIASTFKAGDTFMVPKGMSYQWDSKGTVRKIFCIFQPKARAAAAVAAE